MYVAQQQQGGVAQNVAAASQAAGVAAAQKSASWQGFKRGGAGGNKGQRPKAPPKPQQLHYCDVCKIRYLHSKHLFSLSFDTWHFQLRWPPDLPGAFRGAEAQEARGCHQNGS